MGAIEKYMMTIIILYILNRSNLSIDICDATTINGHFQKVFKKDMLPIVKSPHLITLINVIVRKVYWAVLDS